MRGLDIRRLAPAPRSGPSRYGALGHPPVAAALRGIGAALGPLNTAGPLEAAGMTSVDMDHIRGSSLTKIVDPI
ncbi:MAG: hypothetical protein IID03_09505 [Candidatus Dadabacteria bacterium]|nr:hypothetical protein [Candidatus Dadabacteria bacterium]